MSQTIEEGLRRATELLKVVRHAAMATVNEDGSPHNTPYFFMSSKDLKHLYWGSHPDSQHSKNVERTGQIFVVLYEAQAGGGLYIEADNAHEVSGNELEEALAVNNTFRTKLGKDPLPVDYYQDNPQRMYKAETKKFWVNLGERDADGRIIRDYRQAIKREDLISQL